MDWLKKTQPKQWLNGIFIGLITLCVDLAFFPRSSSMQFFIPEYAQTYGVEEKVVSAFWRRDEKEHAGKESITGQGIPCVTLKLSHQPADSIVIEAENPTVEAFYYWGVQWEKYFDKASLKAYATQTFSHPKNDFKENLSLAEFLETYRAYMIIFSVKGNGKTGFTEDMDAAIRSLGIAKTPADGNVNDSYVAYVYKGKQYAYVGMANDTHYEMVNGHRFYMTSAGIYAGNRSSILIDGRNVSGNRNGLNIAVYDPQDGQLIDSVTYNTNSSKSVMTRADELFYTLYTTVINKSFVQQLGVRAHVSALLFRGVYLLAALVLCLLWWDLSYMEEVLARHRSMPSWVLGLKQIAVWLCLLIPGALYVGYTYLTREFSDVNIDQLLFHMNTNLDGTNWNDFTGVFIRLGVTLGLLTIFGVVLFILLMYLKKHPEKPQWTQRIRAIFSIRWSIIVSSIVVCSFIIDAFWWKYDAYDYLANQNIEAEIFDKYYTDPKQVTLTFPEKKKNLIYIYLESMEISAADEAVGGGKSFNAIPELTDLAFSNNDFNGAENTTLNGAIPLTGGTWTIAGIVSQTCGLPLKMSNTFSNTRGTIQKFMPGATNLGDILHQQGYKQVFMLGSDAKFGNRQQFFKEHGDFDVKDYYWARDNEKFVFHYFVWWGYEDAKLFTYARDEATQLAADGEPFNLTLLTVDTHFTDGWLCPDCPTSFADQYSNVIACSSKRVADYVQWVKEQPWGKDTVIVLSGDHLCMDDLYYGDMPSGYQRKTYVNIINGQKEKPAKRRTYATIDLFPTTLSALGVNIEGDRLGLGTDLYSDTPTLVEEMGVDYMNAQLSMNSDFYQKKILYGGK